MQIKFLLALCLGLIGIRVGQAAIIEPKSYIVELPGYTLCFSLPQEPRQPMRAESVQRFDPKDPIFIKDGFSVIAEAFYDIKGPFWVGAYGSLNVRFLIQHRDPAYKENLGTIEELDQYIHWWIDNGKHAADFSISQTALGKYPAVGRIWNEFINPNEREPKNLQIFSVPLNNELFLDIDFNVMEWEGGHEKEPKWLPTAETLREAIKASIILKPTEM